MVKVVNNKVMYEEAAYNFLKAMVLVVLPAASALYVALGAIWGLPDTKEVVGTIAAVSAFLGLTLHISSTNYNNSDAAFDGHVSLTPNENGSVLGLSIDPHDVVGKSSIHLAVVPANPQQSPPQQTPPS